MSIMCVLKEASRQTEVSYSNLVYVNKQTIISRAMSLSVVHIYIFVALMLFSEIRPSSLLLSPPPSPLVRVWMLSPSSSSSVLLMLSLLFFRMPVSAGGRSFHESVRRRGGEPVRSALHPPHVSSSSGENECESRASGRGIRAGPPSWAARRAGLAQGLLLVAGA